MSGLVGKCALVTGAKAGLGAAVADELHSRGARVVGTARNAADAKAIGERYSSPAVVLDVRDRRSIDRVITEVWHSAGQVDLLCNNAGINIPQAALDVDDESWDAVIDTNVSGAFFVSQALARLWIENNRAGSIVNVSSQAGTVAIEERAAYGASKAALSHLTKVLALEWGRYGIRVNAVAPTFIRTELTASTLDRPGRLQELTARIPLGRLGVPEEVARAVAFLMSDDASMITGHVLAVDGGYTIH